jgi:pyruvate/2-oxoglutarate dehydrogenase complex dihydrolipoamide acyltransferase (E2) component
MIVSFVIGLCGAGWALAQAPAGAPAGTNGLCNDGTYSSAAHKSGACSGHQGVKQWYASAAAGAGATAPAAAPAAAPPPAAAPAAPTPPAAAPKASSGEGTPTAAVAPGGGPGLVWLNTSSNVYHCSGDRWYGKTKAGQYLSEAAAKAKGARPDHGKSCS